MGLKVAMGHLMEDSGDPCQELCVAEKYAVAFLLVLKAYELKVFFHSR